MNELQQRQHDENQRLSKERQEQQELNEQRGREEEQRQAEKGQLDKKTFDAKKLEEQRSTDDAKRFEDKRRSDKKLNEQRRGSAQSAHMSNTVEAVQPAVDKPDPSKKPGAEKSALGDTQELEQSTVHKSAAAASQTSSATPENKPSFAAPKAEDAKLAKPTTVAERTAIRNMEKTQQNERSGMVRPPAHTVERAEQAEVKLQQSQEANTVKSKKAEQHQSPTMEKTL